MRQPAAVKNAALLRGEAPLRDCSIAGRALPDAPRRALDQQDEDCACHGPTGPTPRTPDAGDLVWLDFDPQAGREQAG